MRKEEIAPLLDGAKKTFNSTIQDDSHYKKEVDAVPKSLFVIPITKHFYFPREKYFGFIKINHPQEFENYIWPKSATYTINSFLFAAQIALNAKMLSEIGEEGDAAGAIVATFQNVTVGTAVSFLLSTGFTMGNFMVKDPAVKGGWDLKKAGDIAKSSWVLTVAWGVLNIFIQLSSKLTFPYLFEKKAAKIAADFFTGYAIGSIPGLFMTTNLQIAFQTNDLDVSIFTVLLSTVSGVILSYVLAFPGKMDALGLGMGATLPNFISAAFIHYWFSRERYVEFKFYEFSLKDLKNNVSNLKLLTKIGAQFAFQRLTEWGNLFAITLLLNQTAKASTISAIEPAIQYSASIAFALQGLGHAATMMIRRDRKSLEKSLEKKNGGANTEEPNQIYDKIRRTLVVSNSAGIIVAASIFLPFYFAREQLCDFFLSDDADEDTKTQARDFLWISMLGLVVDAPRIVFLSTLRSWDDVLWPTMMCFIIMSVVGIPVGYGVKTLTDDWSFLLHIRNIAMLISALVLGVRNYQMLCKEEEKISTIKEMVKSSAKNESAKDISCCRIFLDSISSICFLNQKYTDAVDDKRKSLWNCGPSQ